MKNIPAELRNKLAKLLRMQQSSNANEAANAAAFLQRICAAHGINPQDVSPEYDPERDNVTRWRTMRSVKTNWPKANIMWAVARYFNGRAVRHFGKHSVEFEVFATEGNKLQIELYYEYLVDTMERLTRVAEVPDYVSPRSYKANFRKGFALEIAARLKALKAAETNTPESEAHGPALVALQRGALERRLVYQEFRLAYPKTKNCYQPAPGYGAHDGRAAASGVGLHRQATGSRSALALPGGR